MRLKLSDWLSQISRAFVISAREATKESLELARNSEDLAIDADIGGVELHVEGAANLPQRILMLREASLKTEAFLGLDDDGQPIITQKRRLFRNASKIEIEMRFERSRPLESLEVMRDRAVEVLHDEIQAHRMKVSINGAAHQEDKDGS